MFQVKSLLLLCVVIAAPFVAFSDETMAVADQSVHSLGQSIESIDQESESISRSEEECLSSEPVNSLSSANASAKNCGLGQTCPDNTTCCRLGSQVSCCDSDQ